MNYHSALTEDLDCPEITRLEYKGCTAFQWDIAYGLAYEYSECDIFYSDLPWPAGQKIFNKRADKGTSYTAVMAAIEEILKSIRTPVVIVAGKRAAKYFKGFDNRIVSLNGKVAIAYSRGVEFDGTDTEEILHNLAKRFERVGDFCCGYGRAGKIFLEHNKTFVMSDYNSKCIGYISQWLK